MLAATAAVAIVATKEAAEACTCYQVIQPQHPHQCQLCHRKISACLYTNELQHKISSQAYEIIQLKKELHAYELQIRNQNLDFQSLNTKYMASIGTMTEIQYQKEQADRELEELSARLFEEANNMVATEKKKRVQLQNKLDMTQDQLDNERNQLRELKSRMENLVVPAISLSTPFNVENTPNHPNNAKLLSFQSRRLSVTTNTITDSIAQSKICTSKRRNTVTGSVLTLAAVQVTTPTVYTNKQNKLVFSFDVSQLKVFQSYLELYSNSGSTRKWSNRSSSYFGSETDSEEDDDDDEAIDRSQDILSIENSNHSSFFYYTHPQISVPPAEQSEYIMQCEKEDIEPCLGFGNSESRMCVKVMMEYMLHKPCFIEYITLDVAKSIPPPMNLISSAYYRPLWERWSASSYYVADNEHDFLECASCGKKSNIKQQLNHKFYRFRLVEEDDWLLIDGNCRDRLVAVCNFYSFVRNIQLGLYQNRSIDDLYQENVQLRLKMFYSRMGVI